MGGSRDRNRKRNRTKKIGRKISIERRDDEGEKRREEQQQTLLKEKNAEALESKENEEEEEEDTGERLTLAALDAVSSEDEDEDGDNEKEEESTEEVTVAKGDDEEEEDWDAEARALRQAIQEGVFDSLVLGKKAVTAATTTKVSRKRMKDKHSEKEEEEVIEEVVLEDDTFSSSDNEAGQDNEGQKGGHENKSNANPSSNIRALRAVTESFNATKRNMPWIESFHVIPTTPLPFGCGVGTDNAESKSRKLDVHDDLKREVAFYNLALEAVDVAKKRCLQLNVPFNRPDDFFAEMVKTDDHMAKVKDRLIFETKKMEAFEQRKSNREHKLRAKEARAHKLAEKAKLKKQHLQTVREYAKNTASNRLGGNIVRDDDHELLNRLSGIGSRKRRSSDIDGSSNHGPNKKRVAADKKYGFGGKRGRFKQVDKKTLNDMSDYNPRGNFVGGMKRTSGGGKKRQGKRARDAAKSRGSRR